MNAPVDLLVLGSAWLAGTLGSAHCVAMCGGIAAGLGSRLGNEGAPRLSPALTLNLARVAGYVVAGAVAGTLGGAVALLADFADWQYALRAALGIALMLLALRLAGGERWNPLRGVGLRAWRALAPLQRRVLPADTPARRIVLGMLWGWLPCGMSSSLLLVAWLEADPLHGALVMVAFGVGTLPAMTAMAWSGARLVPWLARPQARRAAAGVVFAAGLATALAPWLMHVPALHAALGLLGCRSLA